MVIEAISARGCDVVVKKEDVEKVSKLKKWSSCLFKFGKLVINLVM
jgi:hypothetical protein